MWPPSVGWLPRKTTPRRPPRARTSRRSLKPPPLAVKTRPTSRAANARQPLSHSAATVVKTTRAQKQTAMNLVALLHQKHVAILSAVAVKASLKRGVMLSQKLAAIPSAATVKASQNHVVKVIVPKHLMPVNARQTSGVTVMQNITHAVHGMAR